MTSMHQEVNNHHLHVQQPPDKRKRDGDINTEGKRRKTNHDGDVTIPPRKRKRVDDIISEGEDITTQHDVTNNHKKRNKLDKPLLDELSQSASEEKDITTQYDTKFDELSQSASEEEDITTQYDTKFDKLSPSTPHYNSAITQLTARNLRVFDAENCQSISMGSLSSRRSRSDKTGSSANSSDPEFSARILSLGINFYNSIDDPKLEEFERLQNLSEPSLSKETLKIYTVLVGQDRANEQDMRNFCLLLYAPVWGHDIPTLTSEVPWLRCSQLFKTSSVGVPKPDLYIGLSRTKCDPTFLEKFPEIIVSDNKNAALCLFCTIVEYKGPKGDSEVALCQLAHAAFAAVDATWKVMEALLNEEELEEWESLGIIKAWRKTPETWALWVMDKHHTFHRIKTFSIDNAASCAEASRSFVAHDKENRNRLNWVLTKYENQKEREHRQWLDQRVQNNCAIMWAQERTCEDKTPTSSNNSSKPPSLFDDNDSETKSTSTAESAKRNNERRGSVNGGDCE